MKRWLADAAATEAFGAELARVLGAREGVVIHLRGQLGAGKTTLVRGLLRALGVEGRIRSPTYTLMEPYRAGGRSVIHLDLYRISDPLELSNLGLGDFSPRSTWWLVEWPERGAALLPPPDVEIDLRVAGAAREAELRAAAAITRQLT